MDSSLTTAPMPISGQDSVSIPRKNSCRYDRMRAGLPMCPTSAILSPTASGSRGPQETSSASSPKVQRSTS
ncbi:hypothetical protein GCM10020221_19780 [Streptomyces thioluteus]|uniref:Uncharacterized protein n=1 Tax=Streptomyces thioluteus TaxID=66431 RepID=A0ABN3WPZ7_STRTU